MFRKAVESNDVNAAHNLAVLYRNGQVEEEGVEGEADSEAEAVRLLEKAIEKRRHFRSMITMADLMLCKGDKEQDAVEMGDLDAGNLHTALRNGV